MTETTPVPTSSESIEDILAARGGRYGDFRDNGDTAQAMRAVLRAATNWDLCPNYVREGLDLIILKISRVVTGDPYYDDNFIDIEGYARLMKDRAQQDVAAGVKATVNDPLYPRSAAAQAERETLPEAIPDILGGLARSSGHRTGAPRTVADIERGQRQARFSISGTVSRVQNLLDFCNAANKNVCMFADGDLLNLITIAERECSAAGVKARYIHDPISPLRSALGGRCWVETYWPRMVLQSYTKQEGDDECPVPTLATS